MLYNVLYLLIKITLYGHGTASVVAALIVAGWFARSENKNTQTPACEEQRKKIFAITHTYFHSPRRRVLSTLFSHHRQRRQQSSSTVMTQFWPATVRLLRPMTFLFSSSAHSKILIFFGKSKDLPQIFNGASNSRRIGCDRKISRDFRHRPRISFSDNWTFFPGRAPRTGN